ncbi:MAG TPA: hypothetical protein DCS88_05655 [Alphaproteobacteria bacterium]|nr:hypothetical protein [Alphaproteobacteria bacterium]
MIQFMAFPNRGTPSLFPLWSHDPVYGFRDTTPVPLTYQTQNKSSGNYAIMWMYHVNIQVERKDQKRSMEIFWLRVKTLGKEFPRPLLFFQKFF